MDSPTSAELDGGTSIRDNEPFRLHCNENPYAPPRGAVEAATKELMRWSTAYPDTGRLPLRTRLAEHFGLTPDMVAVGNGIDELVLLITLAFAHADDSVLMTECTFPGYATATRAAGAVAVNVPLDDYHVSAAAMIDRMSDDVRLAFICNPHNPTGTALDPVNVERILGAADSAGVIPVFDEAYMEFAGPSYEHAVGAVRAGRRLLVLRTFSKAWGLASLRTGYLLGPPELVEQVRRVGRTVPFSVNRAAQQAAATALTSDGFLDDIRDRTVIVRDRLYAGLDRLGVWYTPSVTNFVLFRPPGDSSEIARRLVAEHRVLVRDLAGSELAGSELAGFNLPGHLRVTVGTPEQVDRFCRALAAVLADPISRPPHRTGLDAPDSTIPVRTGTPVPLASLFNGYVGANVVFALTELGVWDHLLDGPQHLDHLVVAVGAERNRLLALLRAGAIFGYLQLGGPAELDGSAATGMVELTETGRELIPARGFFNWEVGGYNQVFSQLSALATGRAKFRYDVHSDGAQVATGSGQLGRTLMLPVEEAVLSDIEFDMVADLGCGDATRLIRLSRRAGAGRGVGIEIDEGAQRTALKRVAEAGLADRLDIVCADVLENNGRATFPEVDLVTSFLMMHDLFNASGEPAAAMRSLRTMFPNARWFLIADTVCQDWSRHTGPLPVFSVGFELMHAFMDTPILSRQTYEDAFAAAGLKIERCEFFGVPSTWLWLLAAQDAPLS